MEKFGNDDGWQINDDNLVTLNGVSQGTLQWELFGEHNRMNALAAIAAARHAGVPVAQGLAALAEFKNVKRRMEVRGTINGITVYDDFAHHPTAIAPLTAITAAIVGVILNLAIFFGYHVLWPQGFAGIFDWASALLAIAAAVALFHFKRSVIQVIGACALTGLLLRILI